MCTCLEYVGLRVGDSCQHWSIPGSWVLGPLAPLVRGEIRACWLQGSWFAGSWGPFYYRRTLVVSQFGTWGVGSFCKLGCHMHICVCMPYGSSGITYCRRLCSKASLLASFSYLPFLHPSKIDQATRLRQCMGWRRWQPGIMFKGWNLLIPLRTCCFSWTAVPLNRLVTRTYSWTSGDLAIAFEETPTSNYGGLLLLCNLYGMWESEITQPILCIFRCWVFRIWAMITPELNTIVLPPNPPSLLLAFRYHWRFRSPVRRPIAITTVPAFYTWTPWLVQAA